MSGEQEYLDEIEGIAQGNEPCDWSEFEENNSAEFQLTLDFNLI